MYSSSIYEYNYIKYQVNLPRNEGARSAPSVSIYIYIMIYVNKYIFMWWCVLIVCIGMETALGELGYEYVFCFADMYCYRGGTDWGIQTVFIYIQFLCLNLLTFGSPVKIGTKQRRLAWSLCKDDTHNSRKVKHFFYVMVRYYYWYCLGVKGALRAPFFSRPHTT